MRALLSLLLVLWSLCAGAAELRVHFFDVGQGDSALVISPAGKKVLIDGGTAEHGRRVALRIRSIDRGPLDWMVMTHPHADHMGGLAAVVRMVGTRQFLEPGFPHPSAAYDALLALVRQRAGGPTEPRAEGGEAPQVIDLGGGATLELLWPRRPLEEFLRNTRSDVNSNSIVARVVYGRTAVLFAGDAEPEAEDRLVGGSAHRSLRATVLKVGHHGGRHSSTRRFLEAVSPRAAVISCGANNVYGHPAAETLRRLDDARAEVFRTDLGGEITLTSDGRTVTVRSERGGLATYEGDLPERAAPLAAAATPAPSAGPDERPTLAERGQVEQQGAPAVLPASAQSASAAPAEEGGFAASRRSPVFHRAGCEAVKSIHGNNLLRFDAREDAARARQPARDCNP